MGSSCTLVNRTDQSFLLAKENLVDQTSRTLQAIELIKLGARPQFVSTETGININRNITSNSQITQIDALIKSYKLYLEHVHLRDTHRELSFTRAWTLLRLIDADMLCVAR